MAKVAEKSREITRAMEVDVSKLVADYLEMVASERELADRFRYWENDLRENWLRPRITIWMVSHGGVGRTTPKDQEVSRFIDAAIKARRDPSRSMIQDLGDDGKQVPDPMPDLCDRLDRVRADRDAMRGEVRRLGQAIRTLLTKHDLDFRTLLVFENSCVAEVRHTHIISRSRADHRRACRMRIPCH